jgi:acyl-CoA reductase-like NAD-dependent aldehyde dehydrogenase
VAAEAPKYSPADPLDAATVMGALVDETQLRTVLGYIDAGRSEGARPCGRWPAGANRFRGLLCRAHGVRRGRRTGMTIAREEIFGPVMGMIRFKH